MTGSSYQKRRGKRHKSARIGEQFANQPLRMLESPAWRVLSRAARQFINRLEIEMCKHGGRNKDLPLTYEDLVEYGITRDQIPPAMREAQALGFAVCTQKGSGGNAEWRKPNLWRLTYLHNHRGDRDDPGNFPTHEWEQIKTVDEAEAIQCQARNTRDAKAVNAAKRRFRNRSGKPGPAPVRETRTENCYLPVQETRTQPPDFRSRKPGLLSTSPRTGDASSTSIP
jgi:hypothetical protein